MTNVDTYAELFVKGKEFDQVYFLDNFYSLVDLDKVSESDLFTFIEYGIVNATNTYVHRSLLEVLLRLSIGGFIMNTFRVLGILKNELEKDLDDLTLSLILKNSIHFDLMLKDEKFIVYLKTLCDHDNADVSSQAYLCLGFYQLISISEFKTEELIPSLDTSKKMFQASYEAIANREDASFYIVIIEFIQSIFLNHPEKCASKLASLKENVLLRSMYEFNEKSLELDYWILKIISYLKEYFFKTRNSNAWINIKEEIEILIELKRKRTFLATNSSSVNSTIIKSIGEFQTPNIENWLHKVHLHSKEEAFKHILSLYSDESLISFIEEILDVIPMSNDARVDNNELLLILGKLCDDNQNAIQIYNKAKSTGESNLKVISNLLKSHVNSGSSLIKTGSIIGQELFHSLRSETREKLPTYPEDKLAIFSNVLEEVIRYCYATFVGFDKNKFGFLFSEEQNGKGEKAIEQDLQDSMYDYFKHSALADGFDHEIPKFVDGGRVDIVYKKEIMTIPIELKKTKKKHSKESIEANYIAQAQTYTAGYDQLGIFVLLDLTVKDKPPPNIRDWFNFHHIQPSSTDDINHPDYVISVVIPANRISPSKRSTYT